MQRLIVVSDSHGARRSLQWVLENEGPASQALFFLGDGARDLDALEPLCHSLHLPVYRVRGNCDMGPEAGPGEGLVAFEGTLFFYTHGNQYGVKYDSDILEDAALARGADVALFGHTHQRELYHRESAVLPTQFNPGSLANGSYGIITCTPGRVVYEYREVPKK